jgi:hypothetical protein
MKRHEVIKIRLSLKGLQVFEELVDKALNSDVSKGAHIFRASLKDIEKNQIKVEEEEVLHFAVICSLVADLVEQGWRLETFDIDSANLYLDAPSAEKSGSETTEDVKSRIRAGLVAVSNKQLASSSVQEFLAKMEKNRDYLGRKVSIFNLIDDGENLFKEIRGFKKSSVEEGLNKLIKPYVQVCEDNLVCEKTGLPLLDVWRYFRHTWSLEYKPLPGRTMRLLIRNKARKDHPVIGIAMLASPAMNLFVRDEWIGWRMDDLFNGLMDGKINPSQVGPFLYGTVKEALKNVRKDDLLTAKELSTPNDLTILKLKQIATVSKSNRRGELSLAEDRYNGDLSSEESEQEIVDIRDFKNGDKLNWKKLSGTSLYKKKRAETLVPLLKSYWHFKGANIEKEPAAAVYALLSTKSGRDAISVALNELRKLRLASQVADVSVCGSVAPYNELLGGKLVTMLMGSEDVREIYKQKYDRKVSEIASQLAGKPIYRSTDLLVLTTTSLYGIGSSQYNRIKIGKKYVPGLSQDFEWKKLRLTEGFGVTHLSDETVSLARKLCRQVHGVKRVNSVFGEGSSPKVRLIREALLILGIDAEIVMKHGMTRMVYAYEYYPGARGDLSGFCPTEKISKIPSVNTLSKAWIKRWVVERVKRQDILDKLKSMKSDVISQNLKTRISDYSKLHAFVSDDADLIRNDIAAE